MLEWATMAWTEMQSTGPPGGAGWGGGDGEEAAAASLGMTHAGYLKLFQLSRPCLGRTYDVIMLDEAQDSNPCIASIVLRETRCARILVGDSHQVQGREGETQKERQTDREKSVVGVCRMASVDCCSLWCN